MCVLSALDCCLLFCFNYYYCLLAMTLGSGGEGNVVHADEKIAAKELSFGQQIFFSGRMSWAGVFLSLQWHDRRKGATL